MPTFLIVAGLVLFILGLYGLHARRSKRRDARREVVEAFCANSAACSCGGSRSAAK